jgi:pyruvate/2-oxoglutarate/acetoin dehydrogenase E1 component
MTTVLDSLNNALHSVLEEDERVILLGEDILDPYGGAFKVTRGLSTKYPERVITTPVSEAGIVGVAAGMALRGLRPVVEIMFGDFLTLTADQLINHIAKYRYMYNDKVRIPLVIRTPMGGRRGYGPTHSQTLEKLYLGVPGLRVLAPNSLGDPGRLLRAAILEDDDPVLFIENKLLYNLPIMRENEDNEFTVKMAPPGAEVSEWIRGNPASINGYAQSIALTIRGAPPPVLTIAAYGYTAELCRQAVQRLAYANEVFAELVIPTQLSPFETGPILESTSRTGRLLVVEEGTYSLGWGAEIVARVAQDLGNQLICARRLAGREHPIPASLPLEEATLPVTAEIVEAAKKMI